MLAARRPRTNLSSAAALLAELPETLAGAWGEKPAEFTDCESYQALLSELS